MLSLMISLLLILGTVDRDTHPDLDWELLEAIERVESGGDSDAVGDNGEAVGILQIHQIMVDDCNRILGEDTFTYEDRWDIDKSEEMFWIYTNHYSENESREVMAKRWNIGPSADLNSDAANRYWQKVYDELQK